MGPGGPGDPGSSSESKKRKMARDRGDILSFEDLGFHTGLRKLPVDKKNVDVYVHIKSKNEEKPMKRLNRWLLEKRISSITKTVSKASFNREGDLILKVKGEDEAAKLIKTDKLGDWPVDIQKHATLNTSKGVVFSTDMCWQKEEDIVTALQERCNVKEVYIPKRRKTNASLATGGTQDERQIPTGIVIISFDQVEPPTAIPYGFEKLDVRPYVPNPMKCVLCQELGHTKKRCEKGYILCRECGHENSTDHKCKGKRCVNCKTEGHTANDRDCPSYLRAKEIEKIMVFNKKTKFEARKLFYDRYSSLERFMELRGLTSAEILKKAVNNNKKDTPNETEQTAQKRTTPSRQELQQTNTTTHKKDSRTKQTTHTEKIEDSEMEAETVEDQPRTEVKVLKNRFRLMKFRTLERGITYYISTSFQEGKTPYLDLSKYKGKNQKYADELAYLKQAFNNENLMKAIQLKLNNNLNEHILELTYQDNQIYLKTNSTLNTESSDESESSENSMNVNVDQD